ncbi:stage II sporulation protein M [Natrinema salsiterrestre]|uniref:Stage II sporulation protein M n=1 Tax=Natrinema salsiterrestre TaxID=2950540 RepID=A0A9Q4KZ42_9EURY|nr:stage II sporulation protein M [Natrinema salsiterrestre]MDF9744139.1 stage II sporulation protein M [Natrinema salsiterrestre]
MSLSDYVSAVVAVLRRRPADVLPMYVLGAAITAIVRVVPFVAIAVAYVLLATSGRLDPIRAQLAELDPPPTDPNADPEAYDRFLSDIEPIFEQILTTEIVALLGVTAVVSVLLFAVLSAAVAAGQLAACYSRLRDNRGLVAGLEGARRYWLRFFGLFVLELVIWSGALLLVVSGAALFAGSISFAPATAVLTLPVALLGGLVLFVLLVIVRAVFAFAPAAVVVDDAGVFGAVRNAAGLLRSQPVEAVFYYIVAFVGVGAVAGITGLLSLVDVVTIGSLLSILVVLPALDLLKTAVYCGYRDRLAPPESPSLSLRDQFRAGLRHGWTEMSAFVRSNLGLHALAVGLILLGFWMGWAAAGPLVGAVDASIASRLEGWLPPAMALELFGNNWLVALVTAYAGIALVLPAIVSLLFNGVALGIIARLEVDPVELAAFVVPHGIIEIPAILIASALGISVGVTAWRTWRGPAGRTDLADALERAFWVLVGVGILLAIAAVIEGFISPYYYRLFL